MKRFILAALLASASTVAYAGCTTVATIGNIKFLNGAADNTCTDKDDLKLFLDGVATQNSAFGSLGGNNNAGPDSNIDIASNGGGFGASKDANGFATFKSVVDNVTEYEATSHIGTFLPKTGTPGVEFLGFDGSLFRGQLTNNPNTPSQKWDGDVTIVVDLLGPGGTTTRIDHTYTGFKMNKDIGVIGFDEINEPGLFVKDYFAVAGDVNAFGNPVAKGLGSWDEFKQIEMSVPGAVAAIPEPSTWALGIVGFGLMGLMGYRRSIKRPVLSAA